MLTATKIQPQIWQLVAFTEVINNWHHTRECGLQQAPHSCRYGASCSAGSAEFDEAERKAESETSWKMVENVCPQTADQFRDAVQIVIVSILQLCEFPRNPRKIAVVMNQAWFHLHPQCKYLPQSCPHCVWRVISVLQDKHVWLEHCLCTTCHIYCPNLVRFTFCLGSDAVRHC